MAKPIKRKKNGAARLNVPPLAIKTAIILVIVVFLGLSVYRGVVSVVFDSNYFLVKKIVIDPALNFINKRDLAAIKGVNIFKVDVKVLEERLVRKYPTVSSLKVMKHFPDEIAVTAKKRAAFVQASLAGRVAALDEKGTIVSWADRRDDTIPLVLGVEAASEEIKPGNQLNGKDIQAALQILKDFQADENLSAYMISKIDVHNSLQINVYLLHDLKVIFDAQDIARKIKVLSFIIAQESFDVQAVNYIDLRFQEPILKKAK